MHDLKLNGLPILGGGRSMNIKTNISGLDYPPLRVASHDAAGEDGGYVSSIFYSSRPITIEGVVTNKDCDIYEAARRDLLSSVRIVRDLSGVITPVTLTGTTPAGLTLTTAVYPKGPPQMSIKDPNQATFQ